MASKSKLRPNVAYGSVSQLDNDDDSRTITFQKLVDCYSQSLPLQIQLEQGYYGPYSQLTLCTEDKYQVHCVKKMKVITIQDSQGTRYSVPVNSAFKFGLVYSSGAYGNVAPDSTFPSCSDIMSWPMLPKVVCVTKGWRGGNGMPSLQENEVAIVLGKQNPLPGKDELLVFSLLTHSRKLLPADCPACFSTDPACVQLHLTEIIEYMASPFPCQAFLYVDQSALPKHLKLPSGLLTKPVTLVECKEEVSLLLSAVTKACACPQLLDVPVGSIFSDLELSIVSPDTEAVVYPTEKVIQDLDVRNLLYYKAGKSSRYVKTQSVFYMAVRDGYEKAGISLVSSLGTKSFPISSEPKASAVGAIYEVLPDWPPNDAHYTKMSPPTPPVRALKPTTAPKPQVKPKPAVLRTTEECLHVDPAYPAIEISTPAKATTSVTTAGKKCEDDYIYIEPFQRLIGSSPNVQHSLKPKPSEKPQQTPQTGNNKLSPLFEDRFQVLESRLTKQEDTLKALAFQVEQLGGHMRSIEVSLQGERSNRVIIPGCSVPPPHSDVSLQEKNKCFVYSLDTAQMQQLLDAMQLTQYKEVFKQECVDGEILMELDDDDLQTELGIASKLHRIRLLRVIQGLQSVEDILK